ncbi:hypothetical protein [Salinigranum sp. GCM10025319]|uniref:hypothetical protein n=1 Tax=Salinigranum sp. GCM10025319 TaxID=3252687 RepID=UPI0036160158
MRFPELHARDLDGRSVTLPGDVGAGPALLLVRFAPRLDRDVETWLPSAGDLADTLDDFPCYDLLVLPELPAAVESSLTDELRTASDGGHDTRDARDERGGAGRRNDAPAVRSLTAHTDLAAFRRALVLDRVDRVYALVLRDGRVRWRAFGPLTGTLERSLRAAVERFSRSRDDGLVTS